MEPSNRGKWWPLITRDPEKYKEQFIQLYRDRGLSIRQMSESLGISESSMLRIFKALDIPTRRQGVKISDTRTSKLWGIPVEEWFTIGPNQIAVKYKLRSSYVYSFFGRWRNDLQERYTADVKSRDKTQFKNKTTHSSSRLSPGPLADEGDKT